MNINLDRTRREHLAERLAAAYFDLEVSALHSPVPDSDRWLRAADVALAQLVAPMGRWQLAEAICVAHAGGGDECLRIATENDDWINWLCAADAALEDVQT